MKYQLFRMTPLTILFTKCAFDISFCQQFQCKNLAARMFQMHMSCKNGLLMKPSKIMLYQLGCFAKTVAGN